MSEAPVTFWNHFKEYLEEKLKEIGLSEDSIKEALREEVVQELDRRKTTVIARPSVSESTFYYYGPTPTSIMAQNGDILVFYRVANIHDIDNRAYLVYKRSTDGGLTWSDPVTIVSHPSWGARNLSVGIAEDGSIILFFEYYEEPIIYHGLHYIRSEDNGVTWSTPTELPPPSGYDNILSNCGRILTRRDGVMLLPLCALRTGDTRYSAILYISGDNGKSWSFLSVIARDPTQTLDFFEPEISRVSFRTADRDRLIAIMRTNDSFYKAYSDDAGATWGSYTGIKSTPDLSVHGKPLGLTLAENGMLVMGFRSYIGGFWSLNIAVSMDAGLNWVNSTRLDREMSADRGFDIGYPTFIDLRDGRLLCIYVRPWWFNPAKTEIIGQFIYLKDITPKRYKYVIDLIENLTVAHSSESSLDDCTTLGLNNAESLAISIQVTYNAAASSGCRVHIYTSIDGESWDTEELTHFDPEFTAGATVRKTAYIYPRTEFVKVTVENLDGAQSLTVDWVKATVGVSS